MIIGMGMQRRVYGVVGTRAIVVCTSCSMTVLASAASAIIDDAGAMSQVLFVSAEAPSGGTGQTWNAAFNDLSDALDAATASGGLVDQIWVAQGVYVPTRGADPADPRTWTFQLVDGVDVYGGFKGNETRLEQRDWDAYPTFLSGDILGNDEAGFVNNVENVTHVVSADRIEVNPAGIDGFEISGGNAAGNLANFDHSGGGLRLLSSKVSIRNCRIHDNSSLSGGGGVFVMAGEVEVLNCDISNNRSAQGAGLFTKFTVTVRECAIRDNVTWILASGAAGLQVGRDSVVVSCVIEGNETLNGDYGGILISDRAWMINCTVVGNVAQNGRSGGVGVGASAHVVNSIIIGNVGHFSGGIYIAGSSPLEGPSVVNSVIAFNEGSRDFGGIEIGGNVAPRIVNTIVWGNEAVAPPSLSVQIGGGMIPRIDWSCVQFWDGTLGGTGNFGDNPQFVDPFGPDGIRGTQDDDLRIQRLSPCAQAGNNGAVPADAGDLDRDGNRFEPTPLDIANQPRFRCDLGGGSSGVAFRTDIGAHEFQPPSCIANFNNDCDLDIFDLLAFQTALISGDPRADLDHSTGVGVFDIFDFLAFQDHFVTGCP